jgi:hypothetical protein
MIADVDRGDGSGSAPERDRLPAWLRPASPAPVWIGLALVTAGFAVLAFTWAKVAGLLDVALQVPYLVSGGSGGTSLVIAGLAIVHTAVRRREQARRHRSLERLADSLAELRGALARSEEG